MKHKKQLMAAGMLACFLVVAAGRENLSFSPFSKTYSFSGVSEVSAGPSRTACVIDNGSKAVLLLDQEGELTQRIEGGSTAADFYYAAHACEDGDGNLYIADIAYGEEGTRILEEHVILINGGARRILYEKNYRGMEDPPMQYGNIYELKFENGKVGFTIREDGELSYYELDGSSAVKVCSVSSDYDVSDASFDTATKTFAITTRQGKIFTRSGDDEAWNEAASYEEEQLPWDIVCHGGRFYVSDLRTRQIRIAPLLQTAGKTETAELYSDESVYYSVSMVPDGSGILMTDHGGISRLDPVSGEKEDKLDVTIAFYWKIVCVWLCLLLFLAGAAYFLSLLARLILRRIFASQNRKEIIRIILVACSTIIVSIAVSFSSITALIDQGRESMEENLKLFGHVMAKMIDADELSSLAAVPASYHSPEFNRIKKPLDNMIDAGYEQGIYYYYILYAAGESDIEQLMDYEESYTCGQPIYEYGDNEYTRVFETGEEILVADDVSSYGSWMFVLIPVTDDEGKVVAELEIGTSADRLRENVRQMTLTSIASILSTSAVVIMMILEGIFAVNFFDRRRKLQSENTDITDLVPIRLMVFLAYGTDCMQDAFIAILCSRLYAAEAGSGGLFLLPEGLVIALPMSLQLLMAAAASVFGGRLAGKYGAVKVMGTGFLFQISGFLLCAIAGNQYYGILGGKLFIGLGLGLIYVAANTMAAMSEGGKSSKAFADVSAGVLSGVTIGVGLGSILLSLGSYRLVYASGAALLALGLGVLLFFGKDADRAEVSDGPEVARKEEGEKTGISTLRFLLDRHVLSFFLLILTPFMMALSYREYFFPLFVTDYGISEVQIGQIYLLCGLATLYLGPFLAQTLLKKLGAKGSIVFASVLMAANMMIFVVWPSLVSVLAGVGILSVVISFAYTCQYTYFENVPMAKRYGEGASMGVYSMFESLGQTLGPILYGIALDFGMRNGPFIISALMAVMILGFMILNFDRNEQ